MLMKLFNKRSQLQNRLTFYPLLWFAIGLLVTFIFMVSAIKIFLDNYLMTQITAYTQQIAKDISSIVDRDQETITAFLSSETMQSLDNPNKISAAIEKLLSQNQNFLEGYVVNLDGQTLVGVSRLTVFRGALPSFLEQKIFLEAKNYRIGISGWENFTEKYSPYWYMAFPIEEFPGKVTGVFIVTIDLRRIEDVILTSQGAKYGDPILIDRHANVLVHLDRSKLGSNWSNNEIAQRLLKGEMGTTSYNDEKGQYVLAAYQPLTPYGWGLIVQVPPGQTIYLIRNKMIFLFGLMTIVMFVITGVLLYIAAEKIVTPLRELTTATEKFGLEQRLDYLPPGGEDEIARLSDAFYEMAVRLRNFESQRARYISMIAHDLRSPLTTIKDYFQSWPRNKADSKGKFPNSDLVNNKLEQINRMLNDLLEYSRLDLGEIEFVPEITSVKYICQNIIDGYLEGSRRIILEDFSEELFARVDPVRLQQVIQNILENSLKHTADDATVSINCKVSGARILISITDTGEGIPEEILANLFKPFQTNLAPNSGSFGLGLAIAKKLAQGMKGDLIVHSGQTGTTLIIDLPKAEPG